MEATRALAEAEVSLAKRLLIADSRAKLDITRPTLGSLNSASAGISRYISHVDILSADYQPAARKSFKPMS